jgi:DNA replication protein DnaC
LQSGLLFSNPGNDYEERRLKREQWEEKEKNRLSALEKENHISWLWQNSNVPARHANFILPDSGPWFETYFRLSYAIGGGILFVVMGPRGTGKTQIGTSLIKLSCERGNSAKYAKAIDIFISLRGSFRQNATSEEAIIEKYLEPKLLVIDALEERGETPFEDRLLNHIIDKRYDNLDDTILITNQSAEKFAESVGPSIVSRIHETGDKIICDWESFRKKSA